MRSAIEPYSGMSAALNRKSKPLSLEGEGFGVREALLCFE
jgi:hypothetical protein